MIYHILNGDALKEHFPIEIKGERIVFRECLVDGDVRGDNLEELLSNRAAFISQHYKGYTATDYKRNVEPEIERIKNIHREDTIYYWFEKDLFCQVNWWFAMHLIGNKSIQPNAYLVLPTAGLQYGFGGMDQADLLNAQSNTIPLKEWTPLLNQLWPLFQQRDHEGLLNIAHQLRTALPFLLPAVQAEIDRQPMNRQPGKPLQLLSEIQSELGTKEFGPVFQEFCKRGAIYGFGDLQVKRILEEMNDG